MVWGLSIVSQRKESVYVTTAGALPSVGVLLSHANSPQSSIRSAQKIADVLVHQQECASMTALSFVFLVVSQLCGGIFSVSLK